MDKSFTKEPMLEMFIFETLKLIGQLEQTILAHEKTRCLESTVINEIFRIMHTIKGSAAMMMFDGITSLSHSIEDLFFYIRESGSDNLDYSKVCDIVLGVIDFIKNEVAKLGEAMEADGDPTALIEVIDEYLVTIKGNPGENTTTHSNVQLAESEKKYYIATSKALPDSKKKCYRALIYFSPGCEMENIRAFNIIHKLKDQAEYIDYIPADIIENNASADFIRENGFDLMFTSQLSPEAVEEFLLKEPFVDTLDLQVAEEGEQRIERLKTHKQIILEDDEPQDDNQAVKDIEKEQQYLQLTNSRQNFISVNVSKLDKLMDMVGELVISAAMVTFNPDLATAVSLDNFHKSSRQHRKIINELQDIVMSIRMVPLNMTFQKMNRIVRDMSKKLNKDVELEVIGEETEVDKNIIEHLSDPLMHLIRNAIDHGIESKEERDRLGKSPVARVRLEAKNEGGDVYIIVRDDGAGLNKEKILARVRAQGLILKPDSDLSDAEIYSSILIPGFSTCDEVSEFSGRGVGMDVVARNIEEVGGKVLVDSHPGQGTTVSLKIPLTLAIINGMQVKVGNAIYIIPITSIKESFKAEPDDVIVDPNNNEMIMVRGQCYRVIRLHRRYQVETNVVEIAEGIIVIVENDMRSVCLFVDALLGEQQVVVKALPKFIGKIAGISGCTLLGDGKACLILDVADLVNPTKN
ncbi:MAG: chemotaxis protein CheA [Desulfitobacteriaceae bacterium]|nr:chemotaxis protein CheA [Desulfitobacteriaceae bacterium]